MMPSPTVGQVKSHLTPPEDGSLVSLGHANAEIKLASACSDCVTP